MKQRATFHLFATLFCTILTYAVEPARVLYAANLDKGDSVINITNTGVNGTLLAGPGFGGAAGNICVNLYTFSPDEQLATCCSCVVTPNGLVSLSVRNDLLNNTLTGIRPNSVVIKIVTTATGGTIAAPTFTGNSCTNSAAFAGSATLPLAEGALGWGTTLHQTPLVGGAYATTERPFLPIFLSPGDLASMTNRCTNIIGNGSSYGTCRGCQSGGMAATRL